jgi:hypothetical protein
MSDNIGKNRFRIDQVLWDAAGQEVARYSVAGESIEMALMSSQILIAPHLEDGLITQVTRVGYWCEAHKCYHDAGCALQDLSEDDDLSAIAQAGAGFDGPN